MSTYIFKISAPEKKGQPSAMELLPGSFINQPLAMESITEPGEYIFFNSITIDHVNEKKSSKSVKKDNGGSKKDSEEVTGKKLENSSEGSGGEVSQSAQTGKEKSGEEKGGEA